MNDLKYNSEMLSRWLRRSEWLRHARVTANQAEVGTLANATEWEDLQLVMADRPVDLIEILSQVLPLRHAIWWGLLCGVAVEGFASCEISANCIGSVMDWVFQPDEARRLKARALAESTDWKMPEGLLARAVSWSSGSILPDTVPAFLAAPAGVTGQMISGAVLSFAARNAIHGYEESLRHFVRLAEGVARGDLLPAGWENANLNLAESMVVALDLSPMAIPGQIGFGY